MLCSRSGKAYRRGNAVAENIWSTSNAKLVHDVDFPSRAPTEQAIFGYIEVVDKPNDVTRRSGTGPLCSRTKISKQQGRQQRHLTVHRTGPPSDNSGTNLLTEPVHRTEPPSDNSGTNLLTEPVHRTGSPNQLTEPVHRTSSPNQLTEPAHRTSSPNQLTEPAHRTGSPNRLTEPDHRQTTAKPGCSPKRLTEPAHRTGSLNRLTLSERSPLCRCCDPESRTCDPHVV